MPYDQTSWPFQDSTIAAGTSLSPSIPVSRANVIALIMPSAWTAASLTFQGSIDGDNFFDMYDQAGNEVVMPTAANRYVCGLDALGFGSFNYFKIRSGTASVPVNQVEDRSIRVVLRNAVGC